MSDVCAIPVPLDITRLDGSLLASLPRQSSWTEARHRALSPLTWLPPATRLQDGNCLNWCEYLLTGLLLTQPQRVSPVHAWKLLFKKLSEDDSTEDEFDLDWWVANFIASWNRLLPHLSP